MVVKPPGMYISISGVEGSGKSTLMARLQKISWLQDAVFVREPGGAPVAEQIRSVLLNPDNSVDVWTEIFLFMAARTDLMERIVRPALADGKIVLSDRSWIETLVYQIMSRLRTQEYEWFFHLIDICRIPYPDLLMILSLEPAVGLARRGRAGDQNRIDLESLDFHHRVHQGFKHILPYWRLNAVEIDATQDADAVFQEALKAIETALKRREMSE